MTVTYSSVSKIQQFLRLPTAISSTTSPTTTDVEYMINRAEDRVDAITGHAWRTRYSGTQSGEETTANYEYYDIDFYYEYQTGRPVYLKHRKIKTLSAASGDALEIWSGSSWQNWLTDKTEGRNDDFWLDYEQGMLFIKARYGVVKPMSMRIKYRYGETTVNRMVEDICTKMVAIDLLTTEGKAVILPETGTSVISYAEKIKLWQQQIDEDLTRLKEFKIVSVHL